MESCETLIRCIFQHNPDVCSTELTCCLLTNIDTLGNEEPCLKNVGTMNNDMLWTWMFYSTPDFLLKFSLSFVDKVSLEKKMTEDSEEKHEFTVPFLSPDEAVSLELKWKKDYAFSIVSVDELMIENEELFDKLVTSRDDFDDNLKEVIMKQDLLKVEDEDERSMKISPTIKLTKTTESWDSICGSSSEVEEIMSRQVNEKLIASDQSKNSISDEQFSSPEKPTNVEKSSAVAGDDEVFKIMETEDGLIDVDKFLWDDAIKSENNKLKPVSDTMTPPQPFKSKSKIILTKIQAMLGFRSASNVQPVGIRIIQGENQDKPVENSPDNLEDRENQKYEEDIHNDKNISETTSNKLGNNVQIETITETENMKTKKSEVFKSQYTRILEEDENVVNESKENITDNETKEKTNKGKLTSEFPSIKNEGTHNKSDQDIKKEESLNETQMVGDTTLLVEVENSDNIFIKSSEYLEENPITEDIEESVNNVKNISQTITEKYNVKVKTPKLFKYQKSPIVGDENIDWENDENLIDNKTEVKRNEVKLASESIVTEYQTANNGSFEEIERQEDINKMQITKEERIPNKSNENFLKDLKSTKYQEDSDEDANNQKYFSSENDVQETITESDHTKIKSIISKHRYSPIFEDGNKVDKNRENLIENETEGATNEKKLTSEITETKHQTIDNGNVKEREDGVLHETRLIDDESLLEEIGNINSSNEISEYKTSIRYVIDTKTNSINDITEINPQLFAPVYVIVEFYEDVQPKSSVHSFQSTPSNFYSESNVAIVSENSIISNGIYEDESKVTFPHQTNNVQPKNIAVISENNLALSVTPCKDVKPLKINENIIINQSNNYNNYAIINELYDKSMKSILISNEAIKEVNNERLQSKSDLDFESNESTYVTSRESLDDTNNVDLNLQDGNNEYDVSANNSSDNLCAYDSDIHYNYSLPQMSNQNTDDNLIKYVNPTDYDVSSNTCIDRLNIQQGNVNADYRENIIKSDDDLSKLKNKIDNHIVDDNVTICNDELSVNNNKSQFYEDNNNKPERFPMLNPILCMFIESSNYQHPYQIQEEYIDKHMHRKHRQCSSRQLSFDTNTSSNRDSAVICDSDIVSDSHSGGGTIIPDDSCEDFLSSHLMTASHTVDSLFVSGISYNKPAISEQDESSLMAEDYCNTLPNSISSCQMTCPSPKHLRPNYYLSLPIPPRTGMKRSPALVGVCDLLNKTDSELEEIQQQALLVVNDDDLYPDAVTPSKAESSLRIGNTLYNIPYIDDDAFYTDSFYDYSNYKVSLIEYPLIQLADCDECTIASVSMIGSEISLRKDEIEKQRKKKKHKNRFLRLCGCLSRRKHDSR